MPPRATRERRAWAAAHAALAGAKNRERGLPCQDGCFASAGPRPWLALLDGRGSSHLSQHGVAAALAALRQTIRRLEPQLAIALDGEAEWPARVAWRGIAQMLYAAAADAQVHAAKDLDTQTRQLEFTLAACVVGQRRAGWCAIGDSPIYALKSGRLGVVHNGRGNGHDGEFANQTHFVSARAKTLEPFEAGLFPADELDGLMAVSDGAATRFEHFSSHLPADAVRQLIEAARRNPLPRRSLLAILRDPAWERATSDDRSLAVLARSTIDAGS